MEMTQATRALGAVTQRLGIPVELPFRNFTTVETLAPLRRHLDEAKADAGLQIREDLIANLRDPAAIREHLARLQRIGIDQSDPPLAIGTAKELVESTAKTVLHNHVEHLLLECRVIGLTVIVGAGSVAWLPPSLKDQPGFAWLGYIGHSDQRDEFAKVGALPKEARAGLDTIAPRQWLSSDHHGERLMLARTRRPEPGARAA